MPRASEPSDLAAGLASLARLQQEHRPILAQVLADAGMQASTRSVLVEHLLEEEHERVGQLLALSGKQPGGPEGGAPGTKRPPAHGVLVPAPPQNAPARPSNAARPGAPETSYSVGSLRPAQAPRAPERSGAQQLGSLRPR